MPMYSITISKLNNNLFNVIFTTSNKNNISGDDEQPLLLEFKCNKIPTIQDILLQQDTLKQKNKKSSLL